MTVLTSLHTSIVPKTTCKPSKKLSPTIITVDPPEVQPSLGLIAFIHGVATGSGGYKPVNQSYVLTIYSIHKLNNTFSSVNKKNQFTQNEKNPFE